MNPHEANYPTYDVELGVVVFALKIWQQNLYGVWCTIYTHHKSLRYLMDQSKLNTRPCRWLDVVKDYHCEILYHPRKANLVSNSLSRKATSAPIRDICLRMIITSPLLDLIKEARIEGLKEDKLEEKQYQGLDFYIYKR